MKSHENSLTVFDQELHSFVLPRRVRHFPAQTLRSHNRRRKDNGNIHARHQVLTLPLYHPLEVEGEKLQNITVYLGQFGQGTVHSLDTFLFFIVGDIGRLEERVVDVVGDEWHGKSAEILLQA